MVWQVGVEYDLFPLTPALSPREREHHRPRYDPKNRSSFAAKKRKRRRNTASHHSFEPAHSFTRQVKII